MTRTWRNYEKEILPVSLGEVETFCHGKQLVSVDLAERGLELGP